MQFSPPNNNLQRHSNMGTSSCVAWGWKTLSSSKDRPFPLFITTRADSLLGSVVTTTSWPSSCWSSFSTGFTRHSTRMLPGHEGSWTFDYSITHSLFRVNVQFSSRYLRSLLPLSSTSCSWYFLRSATSFLYFSNKSLLASDISWIAAVICDGGHIVSIKAVLQHKINESCQDDFGHYHRACWPVSWHR